MHATSPSTSRRPLLFACGILLVLVLTSSGTAGEILWDGYPAYYDLDEWSVDWSLRDRLTVTAHRIIRVNKTAGTEAGRIRIWDTFFQTLKTFEGTVTDTLGRVLYRVDEKEVRALEPFSEFRLYSGDVIRAVDLVAPQPPYVIDARWTMEIDNPFFWPDWVLGDRWPRRQASYRASVPRKSDIQFQQVAPSLIQTIDDEPRRRVYAWELHDWIPDKLDIDAGAPSVPLLRVTPVEFRVAGEKGRTDSWEELGKWYWKLTKDRLGLTKEQTAQVDATVRDVIGPRAQAAVLKDWVSDSWRYVAIEIGLGGWVPHPAKDVYENRYGDCKDVVFLFVSMLRSRGLNAYPALIRSRDPLPIDPAFPKDWFDHVVAVTIINGDTLWADPTDARYRLGTLPRSCESRWALVVNETGGRLIKTPCRPASENRQIVHSEGELDEDGNLHFSARITFSGHFAEMIPVNGGRDASSLAAAILGVAPPSIMAQIDGLEVISPNEVQAVISGRLEGWAIGGPQRMVLRPRLAGWMAVDTLAGRLDPGLADFPLKTFDTLLVKLPPHWEPELWPTAAFYSTGNGEFGEGREFTGG